MKQSNYKLGLMMMAVAAVAFGSSSALFNSQTVEQSAHSETSFINGHVDLVVRDGETGDIKAYRQSDNSIINDGMALAAIELFGANNTDGYTVGPLSHIGVGTDGTAPTGTQTGLIAQVTDCDLVSISATQEEGVGATATTVVTTTATIDAGADPQCVQSGIQEAAIYNALTSGTAFARNTFSAVTLAGTDTLDITWTFTFTDT